MNASLILPHRSLLLKNDFQLAAKLSLDLSPDLDLVGLLRDPNAPATKSWALDIIMERFSRRGIEKWQLKLYLKLNWSQDLDLCLAGPWTDPAEFPTKVSHGVALRSHHHQNRHHLDARHSPTFKPICSAFLTSLFGFSINEGNAPKCGRCRHFKKFTYL